MSKSVAEMRAYPCNAKEDRPLNSQYQERSLVSKLGVSTEEAFTEPWPKEKSRRIAFLNF